MPQFAVKDIKPNPFRHMERYPIRKEKVAALRESLRTTGFWGNVVARASNGKAEIAYGHHRLAALKEEYGPNQKVDLLIRNLSDDSMIQIMARENMEEWGTNAAIEQETVRAVVEAFAAGRIHLSPLVPNTAPQTIRYAPSFVLGGEGTRSRGYPYTAKTVATFIGWLKPTGEPQDKVIDALAALQFIEEGLLKEKDFDGLNTTQARFVITEARKARDRREVAARAHQAQADQAAREAAQAQKKREEAERQRRQKEAEAAEAQRRREQADRERRQREAEAAKARDEAARRRAQAQADQAGREQKKAEEARRRAKEEAERSERQRREAEAARQQAQKRQEAAERNVEKQRTEGRRSATIIGRAVSTEFKTGRIGTKGGARDFAAKLEGKKAGPPPNIEDFTRRLMTDVTRILDAEYDQRAVRLGQIVQYREYLSDVIRKDAAKTLRQISSRCLAYADDLWPGSQGKSNQRLLTSR